MILSPSKYAHIFTLFFFFFFLLVITVTVWVCKLCDLNDVSGILHSAFLLLMHFKILCFGWDFFCLCSYTAMCNNPNISGVLSSVQKIITSLDDVKLRIFVLNQLYLERDFSVWAHGFMLFNSAYCSVGIHLNRSPVASLIITEERCHYVLQMNCRYVCCPFPSWESESWKIGFKYT